MPVTTFAGGASPQPASPANHVDVAASTGPGAGTPAGPGAGTTVKPLEETRFANKVATIAQLYGWRIAHFSIGWTRKGYRTPVRYDGAGFPDMVLIHTERRLIWFRELKAGARPNRPLDPAQQHWRDWLIDAGANYDIWRPDQFDDICAALSNGRAVPQ